MSRTKWNSRGMIRYAVQELHKLPISWQKMIVEREGGIAGWIDSLNTLNLDKKHARILSDGVEGTVSDSGSYAKDLYETNLRNGGLRFRS